MKILLKSGLYGQDEYIVCPNVSTTIAQLRERMQERAKVTDGSYACRLIDDLHSAIFVRSLDLKRDYEEYFVREYPTLTEYLRRRARLSTGLVTAVTKVAGLSGGLYYFDPPHAFLTGTFGAALLMKLLDEPRTGATP